MKKSKKFTRRNFLSRTARGAASLAVLPLVKELLGKRTKYDQWK